MKVKILSCSNDAELEKHINDFINHQFIKVIDIKFQMYSSYHNYKAMIMYEEGV